jgi:hypothetical protein
MIRASRPINNVIFLLICFIVVGTLLCIEHTVCASSELESENNCRKMCKFNFYSWTLLGIETLYINSYGMYAKIQTNIGYKFFL